MSIGCTDTEALIKLKKTQSETERAKVDKELVKVTKKFENDKFLEKFGYNDLETMLWLFKTKTGFDLDLETYAFRSQDIKKFEIGIDEFKDNLSNPDGLIGALLKVPRRLLSKAPEAKKFIENVELALSHYKEHTNEPVKHLNVLLENFSDIAKGFGLKESEVRAMDTAYRKANHQYEKYKNSDPTKAKAAKELTNKLWDELATRLNESGDIDNLSGRSLAGDLYLGLRDVLEGVVAPSQLKRADGTPWRREDIAKMQKIHDSYAAIRLDALNVAISGIGQLKMLAKSKERYGDATTRQVDRIIEEYSRIIKELEMQSSIDSNTNINENFDVTGKLVGEGLDAQGQPQLQRKYMPHYVLDVVADMTKLMETFSDPNASKNAFDVFDTRIKELNDGVIDRLKNRQSVAQKRYSVDPMFFLNKYIHDIARFNLTATINNNYLQAGRALERKVVDSKNATEVRAFAESLLGTMNHTYDVLLGMNANNNSGLEHITRFITSLEHTAKMGGNIRSAIRNRMHKVFEWVHFSGKGLKTAKEFYEGANAKEHNELANFYMKKHGIAWEAKSSRMEGVESMTHGAIESLDPNLPGQFKMVNGVMVDATPRMGEKIADASARIASSSLMSGIHRRVENKNRMETYKVAFALAYNVYRSNGVDFIKRAMQTEGASPSGKAIKDQTAWDWAAKKSGNIAYHQVLDLHFDYSRAGKPKLLQNKAGRIFGQYQNYRFGMMDLQSQWLKDANRAFKAGDYSGAEMMRIYRLGALYAGITGMSVALNASFGNLISNDSYQMAKQWWDFLGADSETDEGKRAMSDAFYGVGPVAGTLGGPMVSDIMTLGEIFDVWSLDEYGLPHKQQAYRDAWKDNRNQDKLYNTLRMLNGQAARAYKYTLPQVIKGDIWQAMKIETGLYPSKSIRDWRKSALKTVGLGPKKKAKKQNRKGSNNLLALSNEIAQNKFKNVFE